LQADIIDIQGLLSAFESEAITCGDITCEGSLTVDSNITLGGAISGLSGDFTYLTVNEEAATWQTYTARFCSMATGHYFLYANPGSTTPIGGVQGYIASSYTDTTLHYLGYPDS
jgi:hypothetical protein